MKKVEEQPLPVWKQDLPKFINAHPEWKRDTDGHPVFHSDGICVSCKKPAVKFSHPWYQHKYQILGYCETCTIKFMGARPTDQELAEYAQKKHKKKSATPVCQPPVNPLINQRGDNPLLKELHRLAQQSSTRLVLPPIRIPRTVTTPTSP